MIKKYLVLLALVCAGCTTVQPLIDSYLMKYDNNEYKLITDIRTTAFLAKDQCSDPQATKKNVYKLYMLSLTLKHYAENLPHNEPVKKSSNELFDIVNGLYKNNSEPNEIFCSFKMKTIESSATTIQKMEGSKPK